MWMCNVPMYDLPRTSYEVREHCFVSYSLHSLPVSHFSHDSTDIQTTPTQLLTQSLRHQWLCKETGKVSIYLGVCVFSKESLLDWMRVLLTPLFLLYDPLKMHAIFLVIC